MRHSGSLTFTEREAPCHRPVRQGGGDEAQTAGGGGSVGESREGLPGLRGTAVNSHLVQVSGMCNDIGGQRLAVSDGKPKKVLEQLFMDDEDPGPEGGRTEGIRLVF